MISFFRRTITLHSKRLSFGVGVLLLGILVLLFSVMSHSGAAPQDVRAQAKTDSAPVQSVPASVGSSQIVTTPVASVFVPIMGATPPEEPFCRFGVNLNTIQNGPKSNMDNYDIESLNLGWYINYSAYPSYSSDVVEHAPMIRLSSPTTTTYSFSPSATQIEAIIANRQGLDWFVGNEPDRIKFQDGMDPALYADAYYEIYHLIKSLDPTAQIFAGSIVQPTPVRLEYLDLVLASYQDKYGELMPVDGWSIHNFILNEASCDHYGELSICWGADMPPGIDAVDGLRIGIDQHHDIELFKEQIWRFRGWMKENGYTGKPVYLSEYGVLLPDWYKPAVDFGADSISQFMSDSFDFVLNTADDELGDPADGNRLVQRLSWYSVNDDYRAGSPYIYNGSLFSPADFDRSDVGDNYADYTAGLEPDVNFAPLSIAVITATTPSTVSASVSASAAYTSSLGNAVVLQAQIGNSGNLIREKLAAVTFYNGNPDQNGEMIGTPQTIALSGCGSTTTAEVPWPEATTGTHDIFVQITESGRIPDSDLSNNLLSSQITIE